MKQWVIRQSQRNAADLASSNNMHRRSTTNNAALTVRSKVYGPPAPPDLAAKAIEEVLGPGPKPKAIRKPKAIK